MKPENFFKELGFLALRLWVFVLLLMGAAHCQVSPFMGIGNAQFLDNNGKPLTSGVLYSYTAGTTSQLATFTDYTGLIANPNPIPFGSGARVSIWLTTANLYKFVLCSQNDGATCAPADVLFSVDQVPGGSTGSGGSSSGTFTGTLVTGSSVPATAGIVRVASGDFALCFRNAANSSNLCITKDSSDVLAWATNSFKLPEAACSASGAAFDYLCADSATHRLAMFNNGGSKQVIAAQGVDINSSDQVIQLHFGASALPLGTAPSAGQFLLWNGANITGASGPETTFTAMAPSLSICAAAVACPVFVLVNAHTLIRVVANVYQAGTGCGTNAKAGVVDITGSSTLNQTINLTATGIYDSGAISVAMTAGHQFGLGTTVVPVGCGQNPAFTITATYQ
jgi:hypothetical protein